MKSTLLEKIRSRGFWEIIIRPLSFLPIRVQDIASLHSFLQTSFVSIRGWNFPHLDTHQRPQLGVDWVGQELKWNHYLQIWRFYQSGQFIHIGGMPIDWRDQSIVWPPDNNWETGKWLGAGDTILTFTEIFEFAARLSLTEAGDKTMQVKVKVGNLSGRSLYMDNPLKRGFFHEYTAQLKEFPFAKQIDRSELIAKSNDLAVEAASELFKRFGWQTGDEILRSFQKDIAQR